MTWPSTISLRRIGDVYSDMTQTPQERAERTLTWIERSGPCYVTLPAKVVYLGTKGVKLLFEDEPEPLFYSWGWFSLATEAILRQSQPGDSAEVKIRVDDVRARA